MQKKPTVEALEQRIKELEKEAVQHKCAKEELQRILNIVPVMIFQKDKDGRIVQTNPAFDNIVGLPKEKIIGKTADELFPMHGKNMLKDDQEVLESGNPKLEIVERYDNHQGIGWVRVGKVPLRDKKGNVVGLIGYAADITEQKQIMNSLWESETQKKAILDGSIDRIRLVDRDLRIIWVNHTATRNLHAAPENQIGQHCYKVLRGRNTPCPECPSRKALMSGQIEHAVLHRPKEQQVIKGETYVDSYGVPVKDESGDIVHLIQINRDMTEIKMAEKALRKREEELKVKTNNLQELNVALRVLLQKRGEDKIKLEEKILSNVKGLIFPYVKKLKQSGLDHRQANLLSIIKSNLDEVTAPLLRQLAPKYSNLTPKEIQVANLVKGGKTTKEIAELLISSTDAIDFHRKNLRKKLGLKNTKSNLRSYLLSLQ